MAEAISLEWIGAMLRTIQAEHRTIRGEITSLNRCIDGLIDRIELLEPRLETRFDQITLLLEAMLEAIRK
jgi:flagellar capping protein FliD